MNASLYSQLPKRKILTILSDILLSQQKILGEEKLINEDCQAQQSSIISRKTLLAITYSPKMSLSKYHGRRQE